MNRVVMGACLIVSLFGVNACVEQSPPLPLTSADFAYAIPLTPVPGLAVQTTLLPLAVYRGVLRQDLGDLRVFNGAGRVVPHAIRVLDQAQTQPRAVRVVGQARSGRPRFAAGGNQLASGEESGGRRIARFLTVAHS
jgi:hypothetical protein